MPGSLADLIPKEEFSTGEKWHDGLKVIEAVDVVLAITDGTKALVAIALKVGGENLEGSCWGSAN